MDFGKLKPCCPVSIELYQRMIARNVLDSRFALDGDEKSGEELGYVLSLAEDRLPHNLQKGWLAGSGSRTTDAGPLKVDFILAEPRSSRQRMIAPIHLILKFSPESGALIVKAASQDDPVEIWDGTRFEELPFDHKRAVTSNITKIRLGRRAEYDLLLTLPIKDTESYFLELDAAHRIHVGQQIEQMVNFTPSGETRTFDRLGVCLTSKTLAAGGDGWVKQGYNVRGSSLAVKIVRLKGHNDKKRLEREYRIASHFRGHSTVTSTLQLWCEHGHDLESGACIKCQEKQYYSVEWFMSFALAQSNLDDAFSEGKLTRDGENVINCIYQVLQFAETIQAEGYLHRDISLRNILVVSSDPLKLNITDFGKAIRHQRGDIHTETALGPVPFVAPEVWAGGGYNESVDLWSVGIIFANLLVKLPWENQRVNKDGLEQLHDRLSNLARRSLEFVGLSKLLRSILQWHPRDRPTLQVALEHSCFTDLERLEPTETTKRPRIDSENLDWIGVVQRLEKAQPMAQLQSGVTDNQKLLQSNQRQSSGNEPVTVPFNSSIYAEETQVRQISGDELVTEPFNSSIYADVAQARSTTGDGIAIQPFSNDFPPLAAESIALNMGGEGERLEESPLQPYIMNRLDCDASSTRP